MFVVSLCFCDLNVNKTISIPLVHPLRLIVLNRMVSAACNLNSHLHNLSKSNSLIISPNLNEDWALIKLGGESEVGIISASASHPLNREVFVFLHVLIVLDLGRFIVGTSCNKLCRHMDAWCSGDTVGTFPLVIIHTSGLQQ